MVLPVYEAKTSKITVFWMVWPMTFLVNINGKRHHRSRCDQMFLLGGAIVSFLAFSKNKQTHTHTLLIHTHPHVKSNNSFQGQMKTRDIPGRFLIILCRVMIIILTV